MFSGKLSLLVVTRFRKNLCLTLYRRSAACFLYIDIPSPYRAVNTFYVCYKNQLFYDVSGTSLFLFSGKYKAHKHSVDRAHNC
jgi:hypothetical protein